MSLLISAGASLNAQKGSMLSNDASFISIKELEASHPDLVAKMVDAMNQKSMENVVLTNVAQKCEGELVNFTVVNFNDTKKADGSPIDSKEEFKYTVKGKEYDAIRRALWLKAGKTTAMIICPLPLNLGKNLKIGDNITLSVHAVKAGTNVYQPNGEFFRAFNDPTTADLEKAGVNRLPYGQDTYLPAQGCGFSAYETSINVLTALEQARFISLQAMEAVEA